jgi:hypothetical protein
MKTSPLFLLLLLLFFSCQQKEKALWRQKEWKAPAGEKASLPHLITGEDNQLYLSWIEKGDSGRVDFLYSMFRNDTWTDPELIASGKDWFVNWADYPMIAVDNVGNMVAHYLAKSASGTYSYDVNIKFKRANGNWQGPVVPHDDGTPTEHGFATLLPQNDGTFLLAWLDGRNTGGGEHEGHEGHDMGGAMTIRSAAFDMDGNLFNEVELDDRVCDCCQTTGAMTANGPIIAYRDRSDEEIRDMSIVRKVEDNWTSPSNISNDNWEIKGCPVNGPRLAANKNTVGMAWFTATNGEPKVKARFSKDGGVSFERPIEIASETSGRVDIAMIDESSALVSWLAVTDTSSQIMAIELTADGKKSLPIVIAQISASRASGFPQLAYLDDKAYFAWTHIEGKNTSIKMAVLEK